MFIIKRIEPRARNGDIYSWFWRLTMAIMWPSVSVSLWFASRACGAASVRGCVTYLNSEM